MTVTETSWDLIDQLAGVDAQHPLAALRRHRSVAVANAQESFRALFEPDDSTHLGLADRYAVAVLVAGLHDFTTAESFYRDLLSDAATPEVVNVVAAIARRNVIAGPAGTYREPGLSGESRPVPGLRVTEQERETLGARLVVALAWAQLLVVHPRDSRPEVIAALLDEGWDEDGLVSLAQLVSFLAFQLRVAWGVGTLAGTVESVESTPVPIDPEAEEVVLHGVSPRVRTYPTLARPDTFVRHDLGWVPWIAPLSEEDLTARHREALVEPIRAKNPYFRLLVRDPDVLEARTPTDNDIFFNTTDGIGRAERELAATVTSRVNGCVYCASVHSQRAADESGRGENVDALLRDGWRADLGDAVWNAIARASRDLTGTPLRFTADAVEQLRGAGLSDLDILDIVNGAAFFNWANRLMLGLGEPQVPRRFLTGSSIG